MHDHPSRESGDLSLSPVLVEDRAAPHFRAMTLNRLANSAELLAKSARVGANQASRAARGRRGGVTKAVEEHLRDGLRNIDDCRDWLGQIGYRDEE